MGAIGGFRGLQGDMSPPSQEQCCSGRDGGGHEQDLCLSTGQALQLRCELRGAGGCCLSKQDITSKLAAGTCPGVLVDPETALPEFVGLSKYSFYTVPGL